MKIHNQLAQVNDVKGAKLKKVREQTFLSLNNGLLRNEMESVHIIMTIAKMQYY